MPLREWQEIQEVPRPTRKSLIAAAILAFWLVMMTLLLQREVFVRYAGQGGRAQASFDTWMGIYPSAESPDNSRIGFVHTQSIRATRNGISGASLSMTAELKTVMLSTPTEIVVTGTAGQARRLRRRR